MIRRAFFLGTALLFAAGAAAQEVTLDRPHALAFAERLIEAGKTDEARGILATIARTPMPQADFLAARRLAAKLALAEGNEEKATAILTELAEGVPRDARLELDLGLLLAAQKQDRAARRHLRRALFLSPPADIEASARNALAVIDDRQVMTVSFRAAAAPSTNINQATTDEVYYLGGVLPARLDDAARAQSGMGLSWQAGGMLRSRIGGHWRSEIGASGAFTDYSDAAFDMASARTEAGLVREGRFGHRLGLSTFYERQYFAGDPYASGPGARIEAGQPLGRRAYLSGGVTMQSLDFDTGTARDGTVLDAQATLHRALTRDLTGLISVGASAKDAAEAGYSYEERRLALGAAYRRRGGVALSVSPQIAQRDYAAGLAIDGGAVRAERRTEVQARLSHGRVGWRGFSPTLVYRYTDNDASISFYSYERHGIELAMERRY